MGKNPNEVTMIVGKQFDKRGNIQNAVGISGWTEIRITRGVERLPNDFEIGLTELYPNEINTVSIAPGDACQVLIGDDVVVTGYVDRVVPSIDSGSHSIRVTGRGRCQDLVDCSAVWPGGQLVGNAASIAQNLCSAFGIEVKCSVPSGVIPRFNLMQGETSWEIIERMSRYDALLAYELPDGNLCLTRNSAIDFNATARAGHIVAVPTIPTAASGFEIGVNVQSASVEYSMDQRYSDYTAYLQALAPMTEMGDAGNLLAVVHDDGCSRYRPHAIIAEATSGSQDVATKRALWERNRRIGRSTRVSLTTDGWRDSSGALYQPNTLVHLKLPQLKLQECDWVIGEITYHRGDRGTTADLVIMHPDSYSPEPVQIQPVLVDGNAIKPQDLYRAKGA